jgi:two-component system, OmpR family, sensor histidine kinase KdpD
VPQEHFATDLLIHLTGTIAVALVGGLWPAVVAAVLSGIIVNFFTVPPVQTLTVSDPENVLTLAIFLAVAVAVSLVVGYSARVGRHARQAEAEAAALGELSRTVLAAENSIAGFLDHVREHFRAHGAALYRREKDSGPGAWQLRARTGTVPATDMEDADTVEPLDDTWALALTGTTLSQRERELLAAFGAHLLAMLQREQLDASYRDNLRLAEGNKMRTSILRAVSHDLRTPLAGIKLAVSSLRQNDVQFTPEEQQELLATIADYSGRLESLVGNLLDMSRITSDSLSSLARPVHWSDAVAQALRSLPDGRIRLELPDNMPAVDADPGMLERVIANIVENALKYAPDSEIVIVGSVGGTGSATIDGFPASELRIIDHGQGVPADQVLTMFKPFQRLDDAPAGTGIGLGLAVAKGFTEVMGGRLLAEPTPGGGLTMIIRLPLSTGTTG